MITIPPTSNSALNLALKKSKVSLELKAEFADFLQNFPNIQEQAEYMLVDKKVKIEQIIAELFNVPLEGQANWANIQTEVEPEEAGLVQLSAQALKLSDVESVYRPGLLFKDWKQEHGFESVPPEVGDIHTFIRFEYRKTEDQQEKFLWRFTRCRLGKRGWGSEKLLKSLSKSLLDNNNNPGWTVKKFLEADPWLANEKNKLRKDTQDELPNPLLLGSRNTHGLLFLLLGHPFLYYNSSQKPLENSFEKLRFSLQVHESEQHHILAGSLVRVGKKLWGQRISTETFAEEGVMLEGLPKAALFQEKYYEILPTPIPAAMIRASFSGVMILNTDWPEFLKEWKIYYSESLLETTHADLPVFSSRQIKDWQYWLVAPDTTLPENIKDENLVQISLDKVNPHLVGNSLAIQLKNIQALENYWQAKLSPKTLLLFHVLDRLAKQPLKEDAYHVLEHQNASHLLILSEDYPYAYGKNRRRIIKKSALKFSITVQRNPKDEEQYLLRGGLWQETPKGEKVELGSEHRIIGLVPSFVLHNGQLIRIESMVSGRLVSDLLNGILVNHSEISDFYVTALPYLKQRNINIEDPDGLLRVSALYNYTIQGQMNIWEVSGVLMGRLKVIMRTHIQDFDYNFFNEADEFTTMLDGDEYQIPKDRQAEQKLKTTLYEHGWVDEGEGEYSMLINEAMRFVLEVLPTQDSDSLIEYKGKKHLKKWRTRKIVPQFTTYTSLGTDWFDLKLDIQYGEQNIQLKKIIELWQSGTNAFEDPSGDGVIELDQEWLGKFAPILHRLLESAKQQPSLPEKDSADPEKDSANPEVDDPQKLKVERFHMNLVRELEQAALQTQRNENWRELLGNIQSSKGIKKQTIPSMIKADLRLYQKEGVNWLCFLREYGFGGILADDMGLGKTLQTLAFLAVQKQKYKLKKPNLVIAPTSVVTNWLSEAEKFAPKLKCLLLYGQNRYQEQSKARSVDLIITTYGLLQRDLAFFSGIEYQTVILDEAQAIKNASSKTTISVQELNALQRITLTGTPIENSVAELWSQFNFLMPGFLGSLKDFRNLYLQPNLKKRVKRRMDFSLLRHQTKPFILRRMKQQVAKELPPKTEQILYCELNAKQRLLYEEVISVVREQVRDKLKLQGFQRAKISIFDALLKLRQICCDPRLNQLGGDNPPESAKLNLLGETLTSIVDQGHRVLVFSQFVKMLKLIQQPLIKNGIPFLQLDGTTKNRKLVVQNFQKGAYPVFLISLRAGGVGLNLTAADYVIHYDPWWNPAVEAQATDRAYRIGQKNHVHVYKLITLNSIEEKVLELQRTKQALVDKVISQTTNLTDDFTVEDIQDILSL